MINVSGHRIGTAEVENALDQHHAIVESAVVGYPHDIKGQGIYAYVTPIAGVALTALWYSIIISYKNLNTAKWNVVHEIEKRLPISPYDAEWEAMKRGQSKKLYWPISHIEAMVPWVFLALHVFVFAKTFPWSPILPVVLGADRKPF